MSSRYCKACSRREVRPAFGAAVQNRFAKQQSGYYFYHYFHNYLRYRRRFTAIRLPFRFSQ